MNAWLYEKYSRCLTIVGDLYCAFRPPLTTAREIEAMLAAIAPGDVLCRGYNAYLDGHFIPGVYSHSGIVLNPREMIHSIAEGVASIHPIDFVKDTDRFIVLSPPYMPGRVQDAIDRAVWHCDANRTEYDFLFSEDGKFYCHEFTADCLALAGISVATTKKRFGVWPFGFERVLYLAENLIEACVTVYEFNPKGGSPCTA